MLNGSSVHATAEPSHPTLRRIGFLGNYVPRQCGIATFTSDLCDAVSAASLGSFAVAIDDRSDRLDYPPVVRFTIERNDVTSYQRAAQFLNHRADIVSLQHEYGIFGGPSGSHVVAALAALRVPVVTTLHTVLESPSRDQRRVLEQVVRYSDRVVVMSRRGVDFLRDVYGVPPEKVDFIHHGIPDMAFVDPTYYKDQFGVDGRSVLMTFGLLAPGKGIENVIHALPAIRARCPGVVYVVVGATHPHVRSQHGETYRMGLQRLARSLGVEDCLVFHNRFVERQELIEMLAAADIYLTPYLNPAQITSGTLAWALGAGKAVVSTPYWYAEELLDEGRGVLVPFDSHEAIAQTAIKLLSSDTERNQMRRQAYNFSRAMTWPSVARAYLESFARAREQRARCPVASARPQTSTGPAEGLPEIRLRHLRRMTDSTGLLQHARHSVPNYHEGYSTDDNARALVLMAQLDELGQIPADEIEDLATRYLAFVAYSLDPASGRFRNFLAFGSSRWADEPGSEDCHGRALWGVASIARLRNRPGLHALGAELFSDALPAALKLGSPRAWAYALLGINEYSRWMAGDRAAEEANVELAGRLVHRFQESRREDWPWFENSLAYANARLPQALLLAADSLKNEEYTRIALDSLRWLVGIQKSPRGHFVPVGCKGFFTRGQEQARFDQQPIEACATVSACLTALRLTGHPGWLREAERAFDWFHGRNDLGQPLYDPRTGACHDGLCPDRVNANQGAESTVSCLQALAEMRRAEQESLPGGLSGDSSARPSKVEVPPHADQPL